MGARAGGSLTPRFPRPFFGPSSGLRDARHRTPRLSRVSNLLRINVMAPSPIPLSGLAHLRHQVPISDPLGAESSESSRPPFRAAFPTSRRANHGGEMLVRPR